MDKYWRLSLHLLLWHASSGLSLYLPFLGKMPSQQDIPLEKLRQEPKNRPPFLPTIKPHPLNTLTHGPPPMYWLGTSRWCLDLLCKFYFVYVCLLLLFTQFLLLLRCLILLRVLVCAYPLWRKECVGFWTCVFFLLSLPRLGIVYARAFASIAHWAWVFVFLLHGREPFTINPVILLHCVCYLSVWTSLTALLCFYFLLPPWAC